MNTINMHSTQKTSNNKKTSNTHNAHNQVNPTVFRAYDIRGIVDDTLTAENVYGIGRALGTLTLNSGEKRMAVGRDGRLSSPHLGQMLCKGITDAGCDVVNIGIVPTPILYYATHILETTSGVMLTGSHNPAEYNGLKMKIAGKTLAESAIQDIYRRVCEKDYASGDGDLSELDIIERYISRIALTVKLKKPLKIVVDAGNGAASHVAPALYKAMGCEVHELFCELDGHFPNHHPDPSQTENLEDLIQAVKTHHADLGLAFDGDADRIGVVTNSGEIIWPDRLMMLFAKALLAEKPGSKIIFDVKCSNHLEKIIEQLGGQALMWKTGHSLIKAKLAETQAALAGEMSGHIFFKDRWYGFDDAIYSGARLLEIVSHFSGSTAELFKTIPNSVNTPELKVNVSEQEKFSLMQKLSQQVSHLAQSSHAKINTIDGLRINFQDGWGLVRPSNTTPCLVLRFEADNESILTKIQKQFREWLLAAKPDLEIPF